MRQIEGIWWAINQNKVPGKLTITEDNKITLTTFGKIYDTNIICGFAEGERVTLVDVELDRTDVYKEEIYKSEIENIKEESKLEYCTYKYTADIAIFGHTYERKGDIRLKELILYYTNLEKWIDWKVNIPEIIEEENNILLKIEKTHIKHIETERFNLTIRNPYMCETTPYKLKINNQTEIAIDNIGNHYIQTIQGIIQCIQFFLILCIGDNINVESIKAKDFYNRKIEIILGYGKSNYENRSILKNIIKYKDIEKDFEKIIRNWIKVYDENELLLVNFTELQTTENLLASEYMNLMSAIDSLHLLITNKKQTRDSCAEIVKQLLKETNFILNFSEKEIEELAIKVKDIRRYFVHSNKTQKQIVHSNISIIMSIITILVEAIRSRIMIEIGIDQEIIKKYYNGIENLKKIKYDIVNNINEDEKIISKKLEEGGRIMKPLSKKDKENIAELNAILGTRYRETEYDLENSKDLIEVTENLTAEYMDYVHYWAGITHIIEEFDQSIEVFHPEKWFQMTKQREGDIINETMDSLEYAADNMCELMEEVEAKCKEIWQYILLGEDKETQKYFVGDISKNSKEEILKAIESVIENIYDVRYEDQVQNDAKNFAQAIKKELKL